MQLVAYGAQDIYLTGNPQITFFKVVYRRHTNFSMEAIEQTMNGTSDPSSNGQTATCTISRNGDLIHKVYVETGSYPSSNAESFEGSKLIKEVELEIGGQRIDRHYHEWNQIWDELCTPESKAVALKAMKGDIGVRSSSVGTGVGLVQIPLNFWFCRNVGLALPLIALQYHEVKLKFTWNVPVSPGTYNCKVLVDYIYLDTDERRRFAQVSHEYLIEQIQLYEATSTGTSLSANLNFNHPVKELIWTNSSAAETLIHSSESNISTAQLKLNGHDRFSERPFEYFQIRQPYEYHTAVPRQNLPSAAQLTSNMLIPTPTSPAAAQIATAVDLDLAGAAGITPLADDVAVGVFNNLDPAAMVTTSTGVPDASNFNLTGLIFPNLAAAQVLFPGIATGGAVAGRLYKINFSSAAGVVSQEQFATIVNVVISTHSATFTAGALNTSAVAVFFDKQLFTGNSDNGGGANATFLDNTITTSTMDPVSSVITQARTSKMERKINVYSFGLKPEEHQPSGTCNFSRIDSAKLELKNIGATQTFNIYAVNYNVLRIMSGMGGLAYSN